MTITQVTQSSDLTVQNINKPSVLESGTREGRENLPEVGIHLWRTRIMPIKAETKWQKTWQQLFLKPDWIQDKQYSNKQQTTGSLLEIILQLQVSQVVIKAFR